MQSLRGIISLYGNMIDALISDPAKHFEKTWANALYYFEKKEWATARYFFEHFKRFHNHHSNDPRINDAVFFTCFAGMELNKKVPEYIFEDFRNGVKKYNPAISQFTKENFNLILKKFIEVLSVQIIMPVAFYSTDVKMSSTDYKTLCNEGKRLLKLLPHASQSNKNLKSTAASLLFAKAISREPLEFYARLGLIHSILSTPDTLKGDKNVFLNFEIEMITWIGKTQNNFSEIIKAYHKLMECHLVLDGYPVLLQWYVEYFSDLKKDNRLLDAKKELDVAENFYQRALVSVEKFIKTDHKECLKSSLDKSYALIRIFKIEVKELLEIKLKAHKETLGCIKENIENKSASIPLTSTNLEKHETKSISAIASLESKAIAQAILQKITLSITDSPKPPDSPVPSVKKPEEKKLTSTVKIKLSKNYKSKSSKKAARRARTERQSKFNKTPSITTQKPMSAQPEIKESVSAPEIKIQQTTETISEPVDPKTELKTNTVATDAEKAKIILPEEPKEKVKILSPQFKKLEPAIDPQLLPQFGKAKSKSIKSQTQNVMLDTKHSTGFNQTAILKSLNPPQSSEMQKQKSFTNLPHVDLKMKQAVKNFKTPQPLCGITPPPVQLPKKNLTYIKALDNSLACLQIPKKTEGKSEQAPLQTKGQTIPHTLQTLPAKSRRPCNHPIRSIQTSETSTLINQPIPTPPTSAVPAAYFSNEIFNTNYGFYISTPGVYYLPRYNPTTGYIGYFIKNENQWTCLGVVYNTVPGLFYLPLSFSRPGYYDFQSPSDLTNMRNDPRYAGFFDSKIAVTESVTATDLVTPACAAEMASYKC